MKIASVKAFLIASDLTGSAPVTPARRPAWTRDADVAGPMSGFPRFKKDRSKWRPAMPSVGCIVTAENGSWGLGATRYGNPVAALINEHIGPMAGDELIITVARRLKSSLRSGDILARTGGDEFAISSRVPGGKADVREMARRIRGCFDHPFRIGELKVSVDCAIGCAIQPGIDIDIADQIRHAQIALKRAERTDRIEIYEPEAAILSDNRFGLETELRSAIEEDRLAALLRPGISTGGGGAFAVPALWRPQPLGSCPGRPALQRSRRPRPAARRPVLLPSRTPGRASLRA